MDWNEELASESQDNPETTETPETAEVQPEIQPSAEALPEPFIEAVPPVEEIRIEEPAETPVEAVLPVAETHLEEPAELPVETLPVPVSDSMAATQVSLPTRELPAAVPDVVDTAPATEQPDPLPLAHFVRMPAEVPGMPAAEAPEYPIRQAEQPDLTGERAPSLEAMPDEDTQEVAMPRYSPIQERIRALTGAITLYPDAPVNYVLRGELILDMGERRAAREDFLKGLMLAESSADTADWGYVSRALADRARAGLRRCG